ncbi:MAG: hypothetical protein CME71_00580 [Halobacteriovorax sp.]|nr:hypothetical protein [Halobacteriovorax sp.]
MKLALALCLSTIFIGCVPDKETSGLAYYEVEASAYEKFVNSKPMPSEPDLALDKSIVNAEYPIEVALYNDGKFYYNLPTLGDGTGSWTRDGGRLKLFSSRTLFDMYIDIYAADPKAQNLILKFRDRHGPQIVKMDNENL